MTVGRLQPFGNCPQSDNCHEGSGPTINKAINTRHVSRRHPTTNQSNIKMLELMMMVIIVRIIIIIIIIGMSIPNTQSRPKNAGAHHSTGGKGGTTPTRPTPGPHHTSKQPTTTPHHRGGWGGTIGGGGDGRTGIIYLSLRCAAGCCPPPPHPPHPLTSPTFHGGCALPLAMTISGWASGCSGFGP